MTIEISSASYNNPIDSDFIVFSTHL